MERKEELANLMQEQQAGIQEQKNNSLTNVEMPKAWKMSEAGLEAIKVAVGMATTKHGLYASVPMLCKGEKCPYASVCPLVDMGKAPVGERCPLEIGMILQKYEEYAQEFGVDEDNIVDMGFVKDLIDCDIQIFRAENKMAVDGDFTEEYVITVTEGGEAITDTRLSKASEYKEKIQNKKHKILQLMNSTRKDKAGDKLTVSLDPSSYASQLMQQAVQLGQVKVHHMKNQPSVDADYEEVDE